ncbi:Uncharacterised protein [Mycobacteroides abscessus subsp. abscessus]|nr:Uncharacterised protein [Mycobacteroides abscessus subsp. abscessus]
MNPAIQLSVSVDPDLPAYGLVILLMMVLPVTLE